MDWPSTGTKDKDPMFDDQELQKKLLIPAGSILAASIARFAFSEKRSFWTFLRGVAIAGFVGLMTSLGIHDVAMEEGTKGMIIGVTSFCGDEVAMFLIAVATEARKDPLGYLHKIINALRAQK